MLAHHVALAVGVLSLLAGRADGNFHTGDFVPLARRAQFHGTRTHWHDVLGRHCPRFGVDKTVSMPIPRPVGFQDEDEYKISLSVDGDRLFTPWMLILGKRAPEVPFITLELVHSGDEVLSVRAEVKQVPDNFLAKHPELIDSYHNSTLWPKQLLFHYKWTEKVQLDVNGGLYVLFGMSSVLMGVVVFSVVRDAEDKIRGFLEDVVDEDDGEGEKAE